jgi:hypothetical protein
MHDAHWQHHQSLPSEICGARTTLIEKGLSTCALATRTLTGAWALDCCTSICLTLKLSPSNVLVAFVDGVALELTPAGTTTSETLSGKTSFVFPSVS